MPGKGSDQERPWNEGDEDENGENVGCGEVTRDMAEKAFGVFLFVLFVLLYLSHG